MDCLTHCCKASTQLANFWVQIACTFFRTIKKSTSPTWSKSVIFVVATTTTTAPTVSGDYFAFGGTEPLYVTPQSTPGQLPPLPLPLLPQQQLLLLLLNLKNWQLFIDLNSKPILALWNVTCRMVPQCCLPAGTRFTYCGGIEGWVYLCEVGYTLR